MKRELLGGRDVSPEALAVARQIEDRFAISNSGHGLDVIRGWADALGFRTDEARSLRDWERLNTPGAVFVDGYGAWEIGCGPEDGQATFIDIAGVISWIPEGTTDDFHFRTAIVIYPSRQEQAA